MQTVIDPPSAPVESADFEMKTREMSAVDLEALGSRSPGRRPPRAERVSSRTSRPPASRAWPPIRAAAMAAPDERGRGRSRRRRAFAEATFDEPNVTHATAREAGEPTPTVVVPASARTPAPNARERLKTIALSEEDLEEVARAGARCRPSPRSRHGAQRRTRTQPLSTRDIEVTREDDRERSEPLSVPEIDINELAELGSRR